MRLYKRIDLKIILFALSSLLTVSSVLTIAWFSFQQSSDMLIREFEYHSDIIARHFSYQVFEVVIAEDTHQLDRLTEGVLLEENLIYALVFDVKGRLIFKKYKGDIDTIVRQSIENAVVKKPVSNKSGEVVFPLNVNARNSGRLDIWRAVVDKNIEDTVVGYIRLGFSLADIESLQQRLLLSYAITLVIITVLGLLVSFLIARSLSNSLSPVIEAMHGVIHDENLTVSLNNNSHIKETSILISYFNQMISQLQTSRKDLNENRQRLELALQAIGAGLWDWNVETGIVISNDRCSTMLGYNPEEIGGSISSWEKLLHPDDHEWVRTVREEHFSGKIPIFESTHRLRMKSGRWKWVHDTGKVVLWNEAGAPLRAVCTQIDIDERMIAEIELSQYRRKLEDMVEEKTRELENAQNELVNRAIESGRAQLSAMILHNIGNAMTPVIVQVDQLKKNELETISNYLNRCYQDLQDNIDRLTEFVSSDTKGKKVFAFLGELIKSLKDQKEEAETTLDKISKSVTYVSEIISLQQNYAAGKNENRQLININCLLDDALKMQMSAFERREIVIRKKIDPDLPLLTIDKNKLMQVIVNLIKNAYEAIDEQNEENREKVITIKSFKKDNTVGFEITDTGVGIDPSMIETILKFGESGKGSSGFGLYYCKMFIEANKGELVIGSPGKGKGATVMVNFKKDSNETSA
ncbi:PAS domain-containing sensor histidine kinase [bacterium]|nr:PAS domain-containing sensor histidine kinase [bacterium]